MSIIKDWREDNCGYVLRYRLLYLFSPRVWLRLHKWRKQRANRGWSDRDAWSAGDHIVQMTAQMLQHLNEYSWTDWPILFRSDFREKGKDAYSSLQQVIDDINNYIEFEKTSWTDGLDTVIEDGTLGDTEPFPSRFSWVDSNNKTLTKKQVDAIVKKWGAEEQKAFDKASKAMQFFGRHFPSFWD